MKRTLITGALAVLFLAGCIGSSRAKMQQSAADLLEAVVYKSPTWGCCGDWNEHGIAVNAQNVMDLSSVKSRYQVAVELQSCHTAIVDGYIIEGHVPTADIQRLLEERPGIVGLSVPGMPAGAPGMEVEGYPAQPFEGLAFDEDGNVVEVFSHHP